MSENLDDHAFRALIEPLERELHAYAYRMLGGFHDADDALQDSRLKAWRALATHEPRASFRAWMYRIVTNLDAVCLTVLSLDAGGRVAELTTFVLPDLFAAWGFPPVLDA